MVELIEMIPGPYFLIIYALFSVAIIFFAKFYLAKDGTHNLEIPEPTSISPFELALLTKGIKGSIIISMFNLWKTQKLEIENRNNKVTIKRISADTDGTNKLERSILKSCSVRTPYKNMFTYKSINVVKKIVQDNVTKLESLKLLANSELKKRYLLVTVLSTCLLLLLGGTKYYLGSINNKPTSFLFIFICLSIFGLFKIVGPFRVKHTTLGKKFIASSNTRFEWLKKSNQNDLMNDNNLLYGIALFGISAFTITSMSSVLELPVLLEKELGPKPYSDSSFGGSGCGGSGCSGGSGCGGGCGGCGGGD